MDPNNNVNMNASAPAVPQESGSSAGPIIGAIIILAVIVFGALYFLGQREDSQALNDITEQSTSDEAAAIEADLNSTEINSLDAELNTY